VRLLVFFFCGVLSATPVVENHAAPPAIHALSAGLMFDVSNQTPEASVESSEVNDAEDLLLVQDSTILETAFLAGYPAGVTLEAFRGASLGGRNIRPDSIFDRLPLDSAGDLLTAGGGIFFLLMLVVALVEQLRLAVARP
jgi:hypothetical protein